MAAETIGRHDVKADSRNGDDAGVPDFLTARVDVFEDRDFAGDVEIVRAGAQARGEHRPAGGGERTRAVQHRRDALQIRCDDGWVVRGRTRAIHSPVRRRVTEWGRRGGRPESA